MSVYAIIQARMGSSRLPGKVLMDIGGKPAIRHVVDRARRCREINHVLVATSTNECDDELVSYFCENLIPFFRGSEDDVLNRYYEAALYLGAKAGDYIVRITGDCPLVDPAVCDKVIRTVKERDADYASSTMGDDWPDGVGCEAFTFETLCRMEVEAIYKFEREHVTQYAKRNPGKFNLADLPSPGDFHLERWTLDEPEDYKFLCKVIEGIGKEFFDMHEVLAFLDAHTEIRNINQGIVRNAGLLKSLAKEGINA